MSKAYDIVRWDATYTGNQTASPVITIQPDLQLLKMVQDADFVIPIKITGTDFIYDNQLSMARVEPSEYILGYRPYYQKATNTITIIPNTAWQGYPNKLGQIHVLLNDGNIVERMSLPTIITRDTSVYIVLMFLILYGMYRLLRK